MLINWKFLFKKAQNSVLQCWTLLFHASLLELVLLDWRIEAEKQLQEFQSSVRI